MILTLPDVDEWSTYTSINQFDTEYYNITQWAKDVIDAVPQRAENACRSVTLNFNFSTKEFYEIIRNTGKDCEVLGQTLPPLEKPRISQIVDGDKIISEEFTKLERAAFDVLANDFCSKIEELIAEHERKAEQPEVP